MKVLTCDLTAAQQQAAIEKAMRATHPSQALDVWTTQGPWQSLGYQPGDIGRELATRKVEAAAMAHKLATIEVERKALAIEVERLVAENRLLSQSCDDLLQDLHAKGAVRKLGVLLAERNAEIDRLDALRAPQAGDSGSKTAKSDAMGHAIAATIAGWHPVV